MSDVRTNGNGRAPDGRVIVDSYTPPAEPLLTRTHGLIFAGIFVGCIAVFLVVLSAFLSYSSVRDAVRPYLGANAWAIPVIVDIAIPGFTAVDLWMAAMRSRTRWMRFIPWGFNLVTLYLNTATETTWVGRVAHAAPPIMIIAFTEAIASLIKAKAKLELGAPPKDDRITLVHLALSPVSTALLWRRMHLRNVSTYAEAIERDDDRALVKARFRDEYGLWWRLTAPREQRVLFKRGKLRPVDVNVEVQAARPLEALVNPAAQPQPAVAGPPEPKALPRPRPTAAPSGDLRAEVLRIVERMGKVPGRPTVARELRGAGVSFGNDELAALLRDLKDDEKRKEASDAGS